MTPVRSISLKVQEIIENIEEPRFYIGELCDDANIFRREARSCNVAPIQVDLEKPFRSDVLVYIKEDYVFRFGGEEFVILCREQTQEMGYKFAERVRRKVEQNSFKHGSDEIKITVSIGLTNYPNDKFTSLKEFVEHADQATYQAKKNGRNKVVSYIKNN